jgi:hypothetical protein
MLNISGTIKNISEFLNLKIILTIIKIGLFKL